MTHSGIGIDLAPVIPDETALMRAAEVLNAGEKSRCWSALVHLVATDEVIAVAERLGAGVAKALLGKAAFPTTSVLHGIYRIAWHQRQLETHAGLRHVADGGIELPYTRNSCPKSDRRAAFRSTSMRACWACAIRWRSISRDAARDARCLLPFLHHKRIGRGAKPSSKIRGAWAEADCHALADAEPINPQRIRIELSTRCPD